MISKVLRVCHIGAGGWTNRMHGEAMKRASEEEDVVFAAVCDLKEDLAVSVAEKLGAQSVYTDFEEMLDEQQPDGVSVIVQPEVTPGLIEILIRRGVPFFCEKPPVPDSETHRRLANLAEGLPHVVGYNRRFAPYIQRAYEWMSEEAAGELQSVTCLFSRFNRRDSFGPTLVHGVDTVRYLAGDLDRYSLETKGAHGVRNYFLDGWACSGARVSLQVTPATGSSQELYFLRGDKRSAVVAFPQEGMIDLPGYVELHEENQCVARCGPEDFGIRADERGILAGMKEEHASFYRMLHGQGGDVCNLANTFETIRIEKEFAEIVER